MVEAIDYDSFGNSSGSSYTRYTYTGRECDSDTGLYYYRARWYDPHVGRFISEDPIGFDGGDVNLYGYAGGNPVRFVDPMGLDWLDTILGYSAHVAAGFGDTLTGGFAQTAAQFARSQGAPAYVPEGWSPTAAIRNHTPGGAVIDYDSTPYKVGIGGAVAWSFAMAGAGGSGAAEAPSGFLNEGSTVEFCPQSQGPRFLGQENGPAILVPELPEDPAIPPGPDWGWKGKDPLPASQRGNWHNQGTGESLHPDLSHPAPIGPHWDWKDANGNWWRIFPDGRLGPKP